MQNKLRSEEEHGAIDIQAVSYALKEHWGPGGGIEGP